jgi:hypothetical protein
MIREDFMVKFTNLRRKIMAGKSTLFLVYGIIYIAVSIIALLLWQFTIHVVWDWVYITFILIMAGSAFLSFYMYYGRGIAFLENEMIIKNFKKTKIPYSRIECVDAYLKEKKYGKSTNYDFRIVDKNGNITYITEFGDTKTILEGFRSKFSNKLILHEYSIMFVKPRKIKK